MTMLSFRVPDDDPGAIQHWRSPRVDRPEILRDAVHRHLVVLQSEADAERWQQQPSADAERSLEAIADSGPAEDWSDWDHAARCWFAGTRGGNRPVLVLTRDPVADRIG